MTHPNDTLNGKLCAWEKEEEKHLRRKFGYWRMVEERMVRAELAEEGIAPGDPGFWMTLADRIVQNHKDDPHPWRDSRGLDVGGAIRQQAAFEAFAATELTPAEWAWLAEHLEGSNDPVGAAILLKARARI